jgi:xanthine permease XanP
MEKAPLWQIAALAVNHVSAVVPSLFLVAFISRQSNASGNTLGDFVGLTLIGLGVASVLQASRGRFAGSGFPAVASFSGTYMAGALVAVKAGGLPLFAGMTVASGIIEIALAPLVRHLRTLFSPSVLAVILGLSGIYLGELGLDYLLGVNEGSLLRDSTVHLVGALVLLMMFGLRVWGTHTLRSMSMLISLITGFVLLWSLDLLPASKYALPSTVWFQLPQPWIASLAFDPALLAPFCVSAIIVAIRNVGLLSTLQKETQPGWSEPDMQNIGRGQAANGLGTLLSGLVGAGPTGISSSSVAVSTQAHVYDRRIGLLAGALLILAGLSPATYALLLKVPDPLVGALFIGLGTSMLVSALGLVDFSQITPGDILVLGMGLIFGLNSQLHTAFYADLPSRIRIIGGSGIAVGAIVSVTLNLFFRAGRSWRRR